MFRCFTLAGILAAFVAFPAPAKAAEVLVAVAANFSAVLEAMASDFSRQSGHSLKITTGATGKLYAQIAQGAPFDVMLSADAKTPERIESEGLGVSGSRFTYAFGKLTLWSADSSRIGTDPKTALEAVDTLYIAIANPELAPYGVAAREAMQALGVWETLQGKIVMGQNIGQTFSMVDSGAAEVGFVATSAIQAPGMEMKGSRFDIPSSMHSPIQQDAILLNHGKDNAAALAFMDYLKGEDAKAVTRSFGYGTQ